MPTLKERVARLEHDFVELGANCIKRSTDRAYEAVTPVFAKLEELDGRLTRVERSVREIKVEVGFLRDHMIAFTGRMDRMDARMDRLDDQIEELGARLDGRIDELGTRVDALAESNAAMFQAILERLPAKALS
ncbi:hypothetical protein HS041_25680 [Planomonospora sp. ID67723]|uniref:hypothetical protein n=1 Tax=Planomonospora sp. ID67723 TaxID=2738134 RepID=UPI0018C3D4E8|nr:hypothetical protein [Planomonospora sp. ID67723]MBG0831152.1 hypothetical protein [Planomonospora sp. ID67723]